MVQYLNNNTSGFQQFMAQKDTKGGAFGTFVWVVIALLAGWLAYTWLAPDPGTKSRAQTTDTVIADDDISNVPTWQLTDTTIGALVQGLRISGISLNLYQQEYGGKESVKLLGGAREFIEVGLLANGTAAPNAEAVWEKSKDEQINPITLFWRNSDGVEFVRVISIENYVITVRDEIRNGGDRDISFAPYARVVSTKDAPGRAGVANGAVAFANKSIEREDWRRLEKKSYTFGTDFGFVGFESQYWETIAMVGATDQTIRMKMLSNGIYQTDAIAGAINVPAGKTAAIDTKIYAGPKDQHALSVAAAAMPGIEQTIDYGWFWFLARPFLWAINALNSVVGNYGVAIILFTILLRVLMWPLTKKSFTGMAAMQKMQPEMQRIQKLYANDKLRLQQEMMRLYQTNKTSPMSGCLPMMLQIPIFFALYKALLISLPMRHSDFLWIQDLAVMDTYFILPLLMGATMWWQQRLQTVGAGAQSVDSSNPMAQTQKFMRWVPLLFVAMFAWMPAGLVLYWTVSNLFGVGQMWIIRKK